jgi:aminobenzoyl-glutamate utilization protein B
MNVGVNYLREHVIQEARIHYAVTNTGGFSPNVVQSSADVLYLIRAPKTPQVEEIYRRINKIAQGAAMMTETEVEIEFIKASANVVPNKALSQIMYDNFLTQPLPEYTPEEQEFAKRIAETCTKPKGSEVRALLSRPKVQQEYIKLLGDKKLCDIVLPFFMEEQPVPIPGSSDVGDVSWNVPTAQVATACYALGTPEHSWQLVSQGRTSLGHKGMLLAAKVIAASCIDVFEHPEIAEKAKAELSERLEGESYRSAIPKDVKPQAISKL